MQQPNRKNRALEKGLAAADVCVKKLKMIELVVNSKNDVIFAVTVPVLHTIRTASGSFFLTPSL